MSLLSNRFLGLFFLLSRHSLSGIQCCSSTSLWTAKKHMQTVQDAFSSRPVLYIPTRSQLSSKARSRELPFTSPLLPLLFLRFFGPLSVIVSKTEKKSAVRVTILILCFLGISTSGEDSSSTLVRICLATVFCNSYLIIDDSTLHRNLPMVSSWFRCSLHQFSGFISGFPLFDHRDPDLQLLCTPKRAAEYSIPLYSF